MKDCYGITVRNSTVLDGICISVNVKASEILCTLIHLLYKTFSSVCFTISFLFFNGKCTLREMLRHKEDTKQEKVCLHFYCISNRKILIMKKNKVDGNVKKNKPDCKICID